MNSTPEYQVRLLDPRNEWHLAIAERFDLATIGEPEGMDQISGDDPEQPMTRKMRQEFLRDTPFHTSIWAAPSESPREPVSFLYAYRGDRATKNRLARAVQLAGFVPKETVAWECNSTVLAKVGTRLVSLRDEDYTKIAPEILQAQTEFFFQKKEQQFPGKRLALFRFLGKTDWNTDGVAYPNAGFNPLFQLMIYDRPSSQHDIENKGDIVVVKTNRLKTRP